ncbi:MAG: SGNH/GDSL hydrolase family protein [Ruminococcus sp.]
MKDYGNAVALCGALGCLVLLMISMYFSGTDESESKPASAEIVIEDASVSQSTDSVQNQTEALSGLDTEETADDMTEADTDASEEAITATETTAPFVGPLTKEEMAQTEVVLDIPVEELHAMYPDHLSIVGDSIASGFGAYEFLENDYDYTISNLASWSIDDYTFSYDGQELSYLEALRQAQPSYIYLSMGMNDVNIITEEQYVENYRQIVAAVQEACPDSDIIVAGISPVSNSCSFISNDVLRSFDGQLREAIEGMDSPKMRYFDTEILLADSATGALLEAYDGGDGIHLSYAAYEMLLENLYTVLDEMPIPSSMASE